MRLQGGAMRRLLLPEKLCGRKYGWKNNAVLIQVLG